MTALSLYLILAATFVIPMAAYLLRIKWREARVHEARARGELYSEGPRAQHPHIDVTRCIGCGGCTRACPEGDVLGLLGGKAIIINGHKCIGHSLCADACPVGAIRMVMAAPSVTAEMPVLSPEYETNIRNLFIAGELGGLALIRNAVNQGRACIDTIAERFASEPARDRQDACDVGIIGAGPAGISASLRAIEKKLSYLTFEQDEIGGTVAKYPRQKLVMTSPVEFPMYGSFRKMELSKEDLLAFWRKVGARADFRAHTNEKVDEIRRQEDGTFVLVTPKGEYRARAVILALGRRGTPRKLGIPGEELPKVMYSLIEAEAYRDKRILVVGGGDSAIEAAMGLALQAGNLVTLSYRKDGFTRIKERNAQRIRECMKKGRPEVLFLSQPVEIREASVVLDCGGEMREIPNDYVWIFAGGIPPYAILEKIGVMSAARPM